MSEPDTNYWREKIREMLKRVPDKVNSGGHETAVAYKAACAYAQKQLSSSRATLINLKAAVTKLQAYQN